MSATSSGWYREIYLTIDQGLFVMTFTESNTVEQMIFDAAAKLGGKPVSIVCDDVPLMTYPGEGGWGGRVEKPTCQSS